MPFQRLHRPRILRFSLAIITGADARHDIRRRYGDAPPHAHDHGRRQSHLSFAVMSTHRPAASRSAARSRISGQYRRSPRRATGRSCLAPLPPVSRWRHFHCASLLIMHAGRWRAISDECFIIQVRLSPCRRPRRPYRRRRWPLAGDDGTIGWLF